MFQFIGNSLLMSIVPTTEIDVPTTLEVVSKTNDWFLGFVLFICFLLLALAKRLDPFVLRVILHSFFSLDTPNDLQKIEARYNSTSFVLLSFLSFFSLWICIILFGQHSGYVNHFEIELFGYKISQLQLSIVAFIAVTLYVIYSFLGLFLTSWITGEKNIISVFITQSWINFICFGILFFVIALLWLLNSPINSIITQVFIYVFLGLILLRLLKILIVALVNGVSWYYLILYLCTLEIIPIAGIFAYVK
ncbi:MAG: DUF4271 domain-containing protein [Crocinitomicaceae bacterium]|nr:DUF4271 domain-containing protein [Crocinitomicaceae bacterium]